MLYEDAFALMPIIIVFAVAVWLLLTLSLKRNYNLTVAITLFGFAFSFASLWSALAEAPRAVTPLFFIDSYGLFYMGMFLVVSMIITFMSYRYFKTNPGLVDEFYLLLILATLGSMTLVISSHFASFFLGLEILSVSLFTLIAYQRKSPLSAEAAIKYLVLAGISSSFLLFGMALIYLELGTMEFARIATSVAGHAVLPVAVLVGTGMIIVGVGFKLAVVPFHMWTPDVYEGASSPVAALIATTSKGSVLALLFRYLAQTGASNYSLSIGLNLVAVFSMFVGNFLALRQENVKRVLAYSSISHMGYMLITFQTQLERGAAAVTFYLITYTVSILIAFSAIALLARNGEDEPQLMSYRGLFWRRPLLGVALSASLLSLAGIPLTAGFLGKFLVLTASVESRLWIPIAALVLSSAIGLYYYLRIVSVLFLPLAEGATFDSTLNPSLGSVSLVGLMILLLWFGVFPSTMIHWVQEAVASLSYSSAQL